MIVIGWVLFMPREHTVSAWVLRISSEKDGGWKRGLVSWATRELAATEWRLPLLSLRREGGYPAADSSVATTCLLSHIGVLRF